MQVNIGEKQAIIMLEEDIIWLSNWDIEPIKLVPNNNNNKPKNNENTKEYVKSELKKFQASIIFFWFLIFINNGKKTVEWNEVTMAENNPIVESKK